MSTPFLIYSGSNTVEQPKKILKTHPLPKPIYSFLGLQASSQRGSSESLLMNDVVTNGSTRQAIAGFVLDPYAMSTSSDGLPDMIIKGVMRSLYSTHVGQLQ